MPDAISMGRIIVDDNGRTRLSGIGGQFDFADTIDQMMAARRLPVDRMEDQVARNLQVISAYEDLRGLVANFDRALAGLRGTPSFDSANDAFASKQAFLSGGGAQGASSLVGVNVSNSAEIGHNQFEILRTAKSQRIAADSQTSRSEGLGLQGSFEINGREITVGPNDSLADIRDRLNAANSGENATGVSASIISVGEDEYVLTLTGANAGTEMVFADDDGLLADLGILDAGGEVKNQLQAAETARLKVDGLKDPQRWESARFDSAETTIGDILSSAGSITVNGQAVALDANMTLEDAAQAISAVDGVEASLMQDGNRVRLVVASDGGDPVEIAGSNAVISGLGLDNDRVIERNSNTINDLFPGVTLNLFGAAEGETITLEIEQNLDAVKDQIIGFVEAYNELKQFLNAQRLPVEGDEVNEDAPTGPLFGSPVVRDIEQQLSRLVGQNVPGGSQQMAVLAQLGVELVDNNEIRDPLLQSNLVIDEAKLNDALLNDAGDVKRLLAFDFQSSDPRVTMLGFGPNVQYANDGYTLNVQVDDEGNIVSANINGDPDGSDDGSVRVDGQNLIATDQTGLDGLRLFFAGDSSVSGVQIDVSPGIATQMSFAANRLLAEDSGSIDVAIADLTRNNDQLDQRIQQQLDRLDIQRESLTAQFLATEQALARMQSLQDRITQMIEAQFNNGN